MFPLTARGVTLAWPAVGANGFAEAAGFHPGRYPHDFWLRRAPRRTI